MTTADGNDVARKIAAALDQVNEEEAYGTAVERYRKALAAAQLIPSGSDGGADVMDEYEAAAAALAALRGEDA